MPDAHPPYQELPPPSRFDYEQTRESVREHGFLEAIVVDENDDTIDGHQRLKIAAELGIDPPPKRMVTGLTEEEKRTYALTLNLARRQLSVGEKRELWRRHREEIADRLRADPHASDRSVASSTGTDHKTVRAQRREMEANGDVPILRGRGRAKRAEVEEPETDRRAVANHRSESTFELTVYYPAPSEVERTRAGLPFTRESEAQVWFSTELAITVPPPRNRAERSAYLDAIRARLEQQMEADPMLTMSDDEVSPVQSVSPTASVYVG